MVDGTGMCGGCRAIVGDKTVFVCVDGPEFDAHEVDFDILTKRNRMYTVQEKHAHDDYMCHFDRQFETALKEKETANG
jgi:ferredoxin--NADP+ reductase